MGLLWFGYSWPLLLLLVLGWSISIVSMHGRQILEGAHAPTRKLAKSLISSSWRKLSRSQKLLKALLLVVLVAGLATVTDAQFGVLSPRIDYVVTQYTEGYSVVGSMSNYYVLFQVNKRYFVDSPILWLVQTIVIPNPSNYSYSATCPNSYYYGYYTGPTVPCGVVTTSISDPRAQLVSLTNGTNNIKSFEVVLTPTAQPYTAVLSMIYDDAVTSSPIAAVYSTPVHTGSVYYQLINITLSDPLAESISMNQVQIGRYGDILDISCTRNRVAVASIDCTSNSTSTLWLWFQELNPGQTVSFALNVTYSGTVYT